MTFEEIRGFEMEDKYVFLVYLGWNTAT